LILPAISVPGVKPGATSAGGRGCKKKRMRADRQVATKPLAHIRAKAGEIEADPFGALKRSSSA
jgi:hypothetical protein